MNTPALVTTVGTWAESPDLTFDTAAVPRMVASRIVEMELIAIHMVEMAGLGWVHYRLEKHFHDFVVKRHFGRSLDILVTLLADDTFPVDMIDRLTAVGPRKGAARIAETS